MIKKSIVLYVCFPLICLASDNNTKCQNVRNVLIRLYQKKHGLVSYDQAEIIKDIARVVVEEKISLLSQHKDSENLFEVDQVSLQHKRVSEKEGGVVEVQGVRFMFKGIDGNTLEGQAYLVEKHNELMCKMRGLMKQEV